jgi:hypothetical protein
VQKAVATTTSLALLSSTTKSFAEKVNLIGLDLKDATINLQNPVVAVAVVFSSTNPNKKRCFQKRICLNISLNLKQTQNSSKLNILFECNP